TKRMNSSRLIAPLRLGQETVATFPCTQKLYQKNRSDVCFGSKADICGAKGHVRFTPIATPNASIRMSAYTTAGKCFKRFVSLDLKELSQRNSTRLTAQVRRNLG